MSTSTNKQSFFMKKNNKIMALFMIVAGIVLFLITLSLVGGTGGASTLILVVAGVVILARSNKPLISFYDDYFETPSLKRFYIDIVDLSTQDKTITLAFEDGVKHSILLSAFEENQAKELSERLHKIINKQNEVSKK